MQGPLIGGFSGFLSATQRATRHTSSRQLGTVAHGEHWSYQRPASLSIDRNTRERALQGGRSQRAREGKKIVLLPPRSIRLLPRLPHRATSQSAAMDSSLDKTTLATISLLESRLHRIEHILYGSSEAPQEHHGKSAAESLVDLERRFHQLIGTYRVYTEILKICTYISDSAIRYWGDSDSCQTTHIPPCSTRPPPTPPLRLSSLPKHSARPSCPLHPRSRPSHPLSPPSHPTHLSPTQNSAPSWPR